MEVEKTEPLCVPEKKPCEHIPYYDGKEIYPGKTTVCNKCGCVLVYNNNPPGSKKRMSKKERRRAKNAPIVITKTSAMGPTETIKGVY